MDNNSVGFVLEDDLLFQQPLLDILSLIPLKLNDSFFCHDISVTGEGLSHGSTDTFQIQIVFQSIQHRDAFATIALLDANVVLVFYEGGLLKRVHCFFHRLELGLPDEHLLCGRRSGSDGLHGILGTQCIGNASCHAPCTQGQLSGV
jgi:hypothetical protein